ncbi:concanavalin A-like lectin/glucanase domain-containing protein [Apodospora peruviana]|uniref:Concanavalin A-like lectin/glucanase domain-containing protein n=1 Tax=Apodospora peruviana TaxID=516989 RepID=A0AAE0IRZ3_9PEZI|nr:concanavalin A-like lectin/glucanase domain-containing protein [Apodospora peruviana]
MFATRTIICIGVVVLTASLAQAATSDYTLVDHFHSQNFFKEFEFFSQPDPTRGFVKYVDGATANRDGLAGYYQNAVYLGVDHTNTTTSGRPSTRVSSKKAYTKGLFVIDIAHMPAGKTDNGSCGLWPALWTVGPEWPSSGEIDILEGVNTRSSNVVTLHTKAECMVTNTGAVKGSNLATADCSSGNGDVGCRQDTYAKNNYGAGFNEAGGGVYVVEWDTSVINAWFFSHGAALPATLLSSSSNNGTAAPAPDTASLGPPLAVFQPDESCQLNQLFKDHNLIINTDFCGGWGANDWHDDETCKKLAPNCEDYVGANPEAFAEAYWLINSIKVYQKAGNNGTAAGGAAMKKKREVRQALPFMA